MPDWWLSLTGTLAQFGTDYSVPVRVFMGSYELAGISMPIPQIVGLQALMVVLTFFLNRIIWHFAIKRFTGVGA